MAGTVRHAKLESKTSRARLKRGRQPHWQALVPGRVHLGFQCWKGDRQGRWLLRRNVGGDKYRSAHFGPRGRPRGGQRHTVLSYEQADAKARAMVDVPTSPHSSPHGRGAFNRYIEFKRSQGQPVADLLSRGTAHILPPLGDLVVSELTAEHLRRWLATMAAGPAQTRPKAGKPQYRADPGDYEAIRRRRAVPIAC